METVVDTSCLVCQDKNFQDPRPFPLKTATIPEFRDAIRPSIVATVPIDDASEYDGMTPVSLPQKCAGTTRLCSCATGCGHNGCNGTGSLCPCHKTDTSNLERYCPCS